MVTTGFLYVLCVFYTELLFFFRFKDRVKIVHFIGAVKPWHHTFDSVSGKVTPLPGTGHSQEFLQVWWNIFMQSVQPNLDPTLVSVRLLNVISWCSNKCLNKNTQKHEPNY